MTVPHAVTFWLFAGLAEINPPLSNDKVENFLTNRNAVFVVTFDEIVLVYQ